MPSIICQTIKKPKAKAALFIQMPKKQAHAKKTQRVLHVNIPLRLNAYS